MPTWLQGIDPSILFSTLSSILTLAVVAAHARGKRLPIIENILDFLSPKKPVVPSPVTPAVPVDPTQPVQPLLPTPVVPAPAPSFPILNAILDALRQGMKVQFTNDPTTGDQSLGISGKK